MEVGTDQPQGIGGGVYQVFVTLLLNPTTIRKTKRTLSNTEVLIVENHTIEDNISFHDQEKRLYIAIHIKRPLVATKT